jgi:hypothetical protein
MPENGRNLCHEAGCPDLCCIGTVLILSRSERKRLFPGAIPYDGGIGRWEKVDGEAYFTGSDENGDTVELGGPCTHLTKHGCDGSKGDACGNGFKFGGKICNDLRRKHGLPEIDEFGHIKEGKKKKSIFAYLGLK